MGRFILIAALLATVFINQNYGCRDGKPAHLTCPTKNAVHNGPLNSCKSWTLCDTICPRLIRSDNGECELRTYSSGQLILYRGSEELKTLYGGESGTLTQLRVQTDGNLVYYKCHIDITVGFLSIKVAQGECDTPLWDVWVAAYGHSNTAKGDGPFTAVLEDDCNFVMYDSNNKIMWQTGTGTTSPIKTKNYCTSSERGGECIGKLRSENGACELHTRNDGVLALYRYGVRVKTLYDGTTSNRPSILKVQEDGNMVFYHSDSYGLINSYNVPVWDTFGGKPPGSSKGPFRAVLHDNCNLVLSNDDGETIWESGAH